MAREPDGRWYVTFTVETADPDPLPETGRGTGLDLGVKDFAVLPDGQKIASPRNLKRKARNLARYQRRLARCQKDRRTVPRPGRRSPALTARSATPAATSYTRPPPASSVSTT